MRKRIIPLALMVCAAAPLHAQKHLQQPVQAYRKCVADAETVLGLKVRDSDRYLIAQGWTHAASGQWRKAGHSLTLTERHGQISRAKIVK